MSNDDIGYVDEWSDDAQPRERVLKQTAPWPHELEDLVNHCRYRQHESWVITLHADLPRDFDAHRQVISHGVTLEVFVRVYDAYHPERGKTYGVYHYFIVPAATYNRQAWSEWLHARLLDVEAHEASEQYAIEVPGACIHCGDAQLDPDGDHSCPCPNRDGECRQHTEPVWLERPFAPLHGPGDNPYVVHHGVGTSSRNTRYNDFTNFEDPRARNQEMT